MKVKDIYPTVLNKMGGHNTYTRKFPDEGVSSGGTFVAIYYEEETANKLLENFHGVVENLIDHNEIHTTIAHSKETPFYEGIRPRLQNKVIELKNPTYQMFGEEENILVIEFESDILQARHKELHELYNLEYDFDTYRPHITISYNFDKNKLKELPDLNKREIPISLKIKKEYVDMVK